MKIIPLEIPGCYEIIPERKIDNRGFFSKIYNKQTFKDRNLEFNFLEDYYSLSKKGVVRGLHFQEPPMDLSKLVTCLVGSVYDVAFDLRIGSPTYGNYLSITLDSEFSNMIYLCPGVAHGFQSLSDSAIVLYKTTQVYSPLHDSGILWSSAGVRWPIENPIISDRDKSFISFKEYKSPFRYLDNK